MAARFWQLTPTWHECLCGVHPHPTREHFGLESGVLQPDVKLIGHAADADLVHRHALGAAVDDVDLNGVGCIGRGESQGLLVSLSSTGFACVAAVDGLLARQLIPYCLNAMRWGQRLIMWILGGE